MTDPFIHPANLAVIALAVMDGPYEGRLRIGTVAEFFRFYDYSRRICDALRRARDGVEGVAFRDSWGITWHARLHPEA